MTNSDASDTMTTEEAETYMKIGPKLSDNMSSGLIAVEQAPLTRGLLSGTNYSAETTQIKYLAKTF